MWSSSPPPEPDWFTRHVSRAVKKYASQSFYNYLKDIDVGTCSTFIPKQRHIYSDVKNMTFRVERASKEFVIPASLKRDYIQGHHIVVFLNGSWQPLESFLDTLHPSQAGLNDSTRRKLLCATFWKGNSRIFPFLDLPRELRDMVYRFALGPSVEPGAYPPSTAKEYARKKSKVKALDGPNRNLLVSCKQVCREMLYILSHYTVFDFSSLVPANKFFTKKASLRPKIQRKLEKQDIFSVRPRIRNIKLSFPHHQFLTFFGAQLTEDKRFNLSNAAASLQAFELDTLELHIQHPYVMQDCDWLQDGCHEVAVGWILDAAFPYVKNHPTRLTGCVKDSTKAAFHDRLETARHIENAGLALASDDCCEDLIADEVPAHGGGTRVVLRPILSVTKL